MAFFIIVFPICLLGRFIRSSIGVCILYSCMALKYKSHKNKY
jgi:hypothetical protein